jgi:uncharacterized protein
VQKIPFKLKQSLGITIIGSIVFLLPLPSHALTVEEVPNPKRTDGGWVTDMADILSDRTENQMNQLISQLESHNGTEIAVVTVPKTKPSPSPKEFATELFNYWGIGKADRDNGVLFLISVGDRRAEIETGYGIESVLPDAKVGNIIDTQIIPQFKQKHFDRGTLEGTKELIAAVKASVNQVPTTTKATSTEQTLISSDRDKSNENANNLTIWVVLFLSPLLIISLILHKRKVFIRPDEVRKRLKGNGDRPVFCATCKQQMEKIEKTKVDNELSKPEKIAQKIGSIKFEGWRCSQCSHQPVLIAYTSALSIFRKCHSCQELTVTRTKKILKHATQFSSGKSLITDKCHCCNYHREKEETIPRLPPPPPPPSSSNSSSSSTWNSCSSSSSSSDFGGGSSGGGGAGGSW